MPTVFAILVSIMAPASYAADDCPVVLASLVGKFQPPVKPDKLVDAVEYAVCRSANDPDEDARIDLPKSQLAYLSLERHPLTLLQACASHDRKFFERHALDLALWVGPIELPAKIIKNCHESGLHLLGADSGTEIQVWAHYFGPDFKNPPLSAGLKYDEKLLDCGTQGNLAPGLPVHVVQTLARCYRRSRGDISITLTLAAGKGSATIVMVGDRTLHHRYTVEEADRGSAFCVQDGVRVSGPPIAVTGELRRQQREILAYCKTLYGAEQVIGPGKAPKPPSVRWATAQSGHESADYVCKHDDVVVGPPIPCSDARSDWPQCQADYFRFGSCVLRHADR